MIAGASLAVSYTLVDAETLLVWALDEKGDVLHAKRAILSGIIGASCKYQDVEQLVCMLLRNMELLTDGLLRGAQPPATSAREPAESAAAVGSATAAPTAADADLFAATTAAAGAVSTAASAAAAAECRSRHTGAVGSQHAADAEAAAAEAANQAVMAWEAALEMLQVLSDILLRPIAGQLVGLPEDATVSRSVAVSKCAACWLGQKQCIGLSACSDKLYVDHVNANG